MAKRTFAGGHMAPDLVDLCTDFQCRLGRFEPGCGRIVSYLPAMSALGAVAAVPDCQPLKRLQKTRRHRMRRAATWQVPQMSIGSDAGKLALGISRQTRSAQSRRPPRRTDCLDHAGRCLSNRTGPLASSLSRAQASSDDSADRKRDKPVGQYEPMPGSSI